MAELPVPVNFKASEITTESIKWTWDEPVVLNGDQVEFNSEEVTWQSSS